MSAPDTAFVLPADVLVIPARDLDGDVRARIDIGDDDFALTRPRARTPSKVVDARTAELLEEFRRPTSIVQAVLRFSSARRLDPERVLEAAHPMLDSLALARLLLPEGEAGSDVIEPDFGPGARFAGHEVLRVVHVFEDTELYQARDADGREVALKLARPAHADALRPALAREAELLRGLASAPTPALLGDGEQDGRPFLALEWIAGAPLLQAAHVLRADPEARARLLELARGVVDAYAELHAAGVLHSDVHPGNVVVDEGGRVVLLDFGLARRTASGDPLGSAGRGGIATYFEPEYARAVLRHVAPPASSAAGEQFGVAALVYLVLSGQPYADFPLGQRELLAAIVEEPPRAFEDLGQAPWPEVEPALQRALDKDPARRFPSMRAFAAALRVDATPALRPRELRGDELARAAEDVLARTLARVQPDGELGLRGFAEAPRCSVNYGAAGLAYALLRMACIREDGELLALADLWSARAVEGAAAEGAFYNPALDLPREVLGPNALYHTASGVWLVRALVARAQMDAQGLGAAVQAFGSAAQVPTDNLDLALGRAGALLGCALLAEVEPELGGLAAFGERLCAELWQELAGASPARPGALPLNLGIAHGWAGVHFATLRWARATGGAPPAVLEEQLVELAARGIEAGAGLRWPWFDAGDPTRSTSMSGWCNGSAGLVFLWCLAHEHFGDGPWLDLARRAAWHAYDGGGGALNLCCGALGSAWALLELARSGGGDEWTARARELFLRAAAGATQLHAQRDSLYKGELALALLATEIQRPEQACMPLFGRLEPDTPLRAS